MTGKVHAILGTSTAIAVALCVPDFDIMGNTITPWIGVLGSTAGSYMPDIDIAQSKLGQKHKWLSKHLTHRGITHTLLFPVLLVGVMLLLGFVPVLPSLIFGFTIGYLAHIFADLFNKKGVPILWPLSKAKLHVACVKTASTAQQIIFIIIWEVVLLCLVLSHWGVLQKAMALLSG